MKGEFVENRGIVTRIEGVCAMVEVVPVSSGCGRCHEAGGCGGDLLAQSLRPPKLNVYRVPNRVGAKVGDCVVVSVPEGAVLRAALLAYLIPALFLIVGAALGTAFAEDDRLALIGAGLGLMLGLLVLRLAQWRLMGAGELLVSMRLERSPMTYMNCSRV